MIQKKILMVEESKNNIKAYIFVPVVITLLYWYWESIVAGNIRVDLLIIYPGLFVIYIVALWGKYRLYSVLISTLIMAINYIFFLISYDLFDKYPG